MLFRLSWAWSAFPNIKALLWDHLISLWSWYHRNKAESTASFYIVTLGSFFTFISAFKRSICIICLLQALPINVSIGFFFAHFVMSSVILPKKAAFFTLCSFFCNTLSESPPNFYHPSENPHFSEDSTWDTHSILLLFLQTISIGPEATETLLSSKSFPAASMADACFLNFLVHQRRAIGFLEHSRIHVQRKGRRGVLQKKLCTPTPSFSLLSS